MDPVTPGECLLEVLRKCFLDNGVVGASIASEGAADPPIAGVANPTLAGVGCIGTSSTLVNVVAGLPGPMRLRLTETMTLLP